MKYAVALTMTLLLLSGCPSSKTPLIKHPDAPMLIQRVKGSKALVAVYDKQDNRMLEYGWIAIPQGWTLHKYDWERFIDEHD